MRINSSKFYSLFEKEQREQLLKRYKKGRFQKRKRSETSSTSRSSVENYINIPGEWTEQEICLAIAGTVKNIQRLRKQLSLVDLNPLVQEVSESAEETPQFNQHCNESESFTTASAKTDQ